MLACHLIMTIGPSAGGAAEPEIGSTVAIKP
jgi:hypothetical protein